MKRKAQHRARGITLLEMLLVIAIMAGVFVALARYTAQKGEDARIERTVVQVNQILDAATAFYLANGRWPNSEIVDGICLQIALGGSGNELQPKYLPGVMMKPPFEGAPTQHAYYFSSCDFFNSGTSAVTGVPRRGVFSVYINVGDPPQREQLAKKLANKFPLTSMALIEADQPYLIVYTQIPVAGIESEANSVTGFNFAGLFHHGACVPVPVCPAVTVGSTPTATTAQIFLLPVSVSGANDDGSSNVYPISSFTAYASGEPLASPAACSGSSSPPDCNTAPGTTTGLFWRACMQIITERGDVSVTRTDSWGDNATMAAYTRCVPSSEASGSGFNIFSN